MPDGTVTVISPTARFVYIDKNYAEPYPPVIRCVVLVELGFSLFETLDANFCVDFRGSATTGPDNKHVTIALSPVIPPEPMGL